MVSNAVALFGSWALGVTLVLVLYRVAIARRQSYYINDKSHRPDSPIPNTTSTLSLASGGYEPEKKTQSIYHANKDKGAHEQHV